MEVSTEHGVGSDAVESTAAHRVIEPGPLRIQSAGGSPRSGSRKACGGAAHSAASGER